MTQESPIEHSDRIITDLLSNKYYLNKASKDIVQIIRDDANTCLAENISVLSRFISELDDQPA